MLTSAPFCRGKITQNHKVKKKEPAAIKACVAIVVQCRLAPLLTVVWIGVCALRGGSSRWLITGVTGQRKLDASVSFLTSQHKVSMCIWSLQDQEQELTVPIIFMATKHFCLKITLMSPRDRCSAVSLWFGGLIVMTQSHSGPTALLGFLNPGVVDIWVRYIIL